MFLRSLFAMVAPWLLGLSLVAVACARPAVFDSGSAGDSGQGQDGSVIILNNTSDAGSGLIVTPPMATLNATGTPLTQQFQATDSDTHQVVAPSWSMDNVALGTIDSTGLFTAAGTIGGKAQID